MNTIGIIGGMSWESTALYYRLINEGVRDRLGGLHSASMLLDSCDFAGMENLQRAGDWTTLGEILSAKFPFRTHAPTHVLTHGSFLPSPYPPAKLHK